MYCILTKYVKQNTFKTKYNLNLKCKIKIVLIISYHINKS